MFTENRENIQDGKNTWRFLKWMIILGIIFIIIVSFKAIIVFSTTPPVTFSQNLQYYLKSLGSSLLIAGACFGLGGIIGFLFGIPRVINSNTSQTSNGKNTILQNDNLVQISDWLTKIIVGVGLTQLINIPSFLKKIGVQFSYSFSTSEANVPFNNPALQNIAIVIILYFLTLGFIYSYLWTRLYFSKMLAINMHEVDEELTKKLIDVEQNLIKKDEELIGITNSIIPKLRAQDRSRGQNIHTDDPEKGKWGGMAESNERIITAIVTPTSFNNQLFNIELVVSSTNTTNKLDGIVRFHLHPTFPSPVREITVIDGMAKLNLVAYGAFTVGAECDNGNTKLELDLSELNSAPYEFKLR